MQDSIVLVQLQLSRREVTKSPGFEPATQSSIATMDGPSESSRGGQNGVRGQSRGRAAARGRGRGRGGRGGFSGSLTNISKVPVERSESSKTDARKGEPVQDTPRAGKSSVADIPLSDPSTSILLHTTPPEDNAEAEMCFICAEPVQLYSLAPCNHRTCHICAIRLRALYKKRECTFCKASSDAVIFTKNGQRDFLSFSSDDIPFKDDKLDIYFESATDREDSLILLRFNCPESYCDYVGSSWTDLRAHARQDHDRFFCDLCIKHSRIFAHEHKLHSSSELNRHIRTEHKYCDYCKLNFYSSDELYIHMRDKHEQCFICKRSEERGDEYQRDYKMLEQHFKTDHYLCESKECLEKKFVVFESEMDYKAHQVAEHGTELSSREKREALRVTANFHFDATSSAARGSGSQAGSSGYNARGKPKREEEADSRRDRLGVSTLASRSHVPGAGGAADHQSRRAQFGASLTANSVPSKSKGKHVADAQEEDKKRQETILRHQRYMDEVAAILIHSDSKMASFKANVKVYRAGETSSKDLVDSVFSLAGDMSQVEVIVLGLVELLEEPSKKEDVMSALNVLRLERTQFPSLVPTSLSASSASNAAKGQIRNAKATSSANSNNRIWENVERAAASGRGYGGMAAKNTTTTRDHFPSLGAAKGPPSSSSAVPGSARHSALANASMKGGAAWSSSHAGKAPLSANNSGRSTPVMQPYSVEVLRDPERSNKTSIRRHPDAFPTLPSNASAASLAAYKRSLFERKAAAARASTAAGASSHSGESTPNRAPIWGSTLGRIDGLDGDMDADLLHDKLGQAQINSDRKKGKQKNVLVTLGSSRRGG